MLVEFNLSELLMIAHNGHQTNLGTDGPKRKRTVFLQILVSMIEAVQTGYNLFCIAQGLAHPLQEGAS